MSTEIILKQAVLSDRHIPTGRTVHHVGGTVAPTPAVLQIARYEGDPGFYLFYCSATGEVLTDTYHQTLDAALHQAEFEFGIRGSEWSDVSQVSEIPDEVSAVTALRTSGLVVEDSSNYYVKLLDKGTTPLAVMRVLCSELRVELPVADRILRSIPIVIRTLEKEAEAAALAAALRDAGGKAQTGRCQADHKDAAHP